MNNTATTTRKVPAEIWFSLTKTGKRRAYYYSTAVGRALPFPLADAEFAIATGASVECAKPMWVGGNR